MSRSSQRQPRSATLERPVHQPWIVARPSTEPFTGSGESETASGDAHLGPRGSDSERGRQRGERTAESRISVYISCTCKVLESEAREARRLVELRDRWLNPPEWVEWVDEPVPGYPKRPVPRDEDSAKALKKRTLTNLYKLRPQWLADAHDALDAAVAAANGWSVGNSHEDALRELLALNGGGPVREGVVLCGS